ncbi:MAG: protein BatD [Rikenellaceae bacterium]|nr:protein BatD [Rikenellaceae bacterium]
MRLFLVLFFSSAMSLFAQGQVRFEVVNTPDVVAVGEVFRIEFNTNTTKPDKFIPPKFNGMTVMAGPSQSQSTSIINGKRSDSYSYIYVVSIDSVGKYTIPSAEIEVDGKKYKSKEFKIEAIVESGGNQRSGQQSQRSSGSTIATDDVLLRLVPSKTSVYRGEPIIVSIKLYTRVSLSDIRNFNLPAFNGFWTQRIDNTGGNISFDRETYNGKIYNSAVLAEYLLYPQSAGNIRIDQCDLNVLIQKVVEGSRSNSMFDIFDTPMVETIQRHLVTKPVTITVKELPAGAPEGFNGAVGQFSLKANIEPKSMAANSAGTYTLTLSGKGNMSMIQAPTPDFPQTFEVYNVKTTDNLQNGINGTSGTKRFEYPFIPRAEGEYEINPTKFVYFDTGSNKYVTLSTNSFKMTITADSSAKERSAGMVSGITKEDLKILGQDIRYINTSALKLTDRGHFFILSPAYLILAVLILAAFEVAIILIRKSIKMRGNQALMRGRSAGKRALKRFKKAESDMNSQNEKEFYAEMLRALWGYISDKLNIPQSQLTKENILEKMIARGIAEQTADEYLKVISDCEFAQYAPVQTSMMKEVFERASKLVIEIESKITVKR